MGYIKIISDNRSNFYPKMEMYNLPERNCMFQNQINSKVGVPGV